MKLKFPLHPSHIKHEYCSRVSLQSPHYICEVRRFALRVSFERCMYGKWSNTLFSYLVEILTLFAIYFSTARLGLSVDAVSRFATLVWVPSGIAIAALLLFGYRLWPGILMGAFLVNLFNGAPLLVAVGIGIGNTLEALVGTYLLKRYGFSNALDHLRDVLVLVLLAMPLSALIKCNSWRVQSFAGEGHCVFNVFSYMES